MLRKGRWCYHQKEKPVGGKATVGCHAAGSALGVAPAPDEATHKAERTKSRDVMQCIIEA